MRARDARLSQSGGSFLRLTWPPRLVIFEPSVAQPEDVIEPIQKHFVMGHEDDRGTLIDGDSVASQ